jgi:S1-C subfamily serine protease
MVKKFTSKPIKSSAKKNEHKASVDEDALEKLDIYYRQNFDIIKPNKKGFLWTLVVLVAALFGLASALAYQMFFLPRAPLANPAQKVVIEHQENVTVTSQERLVDLAKKINPSIVAFYPVKGLSSGPFYQDQARLGSGFILTSDGWLVTTQKVIGDLKLDQFFILTADYQLYKPDKIINDSLSPLVFVHIKAENLTVAELAQRENYRSGQKVFGVLSSYPSAKFASLHLADLQASVLDDVVASTEKYSHFISCREGYDLTLVGAPLVDLSGKVIALINDSRTAIPTDYLSNLISQLGRRKSLVRAYFGVRYIDLAKYPQIKLKQQTLIGRGALLSGYKNLTAVDKNSPAAKAGLRVGDIILSVEDERLNGRKTLTQIIQEYNPGDTLKMTILHAGKEKTVEVKLGKKE